MVSEEMLALGTARSVIRELFEFGKQRALEVGAENVYDFSIGNPNTPPPPQVGSLAQELLAKPQIHSYTSAQGDITARTRLIDTINKKASQTKTYHYKPEHLYITVGAAAGLCCCLKALTCPQDEFIIFAPYFPEYTVFIQSHGGKCVIIPPNVPSFQPNLLAFRDSITPHTKGVIVNSPNNPSGVIYTPEMLQELGAILREKSQEYGHPIFLLSDEPYRELVYRDTPVSWVPDYYDNTIVCYSFSKSLSLAGERIGYLLVGDHVDQWDTVYAAICGSGRALGYVNAPSLFQQVVSQTSHLTGDLDFYKTNRDILVEGLTGCGFQLTPPEGAFYLFPKALEDDDVAFCERAKEFNLLLVPGTGFGVKGYVRLSYCVSHATVKNSLPQFEKLAKSYGL